MIVIIRSVVGIIVGEYGTSSPANRTYGFSVHLVPVKIVQGSQFPDCLNSVVSVRTVYPESPEGYASPWVNQCL